MTRRSQTAAATGRPRDDCFRDLERSDLTIARATKRNFDDAVLAAGEQTDDVEPGRAPLSLPMQRGTLDPAVAGPAARSRIGRLDACFHKRPDLRV